LCVTPSRIAPVYRGDQNELLRGGSTRVVFFESNYKTRVERKSLTQLKHTQNLYKRQILHSILDSYGRKRISVAPRPLGQRGRVHVQNMLRVLRTTRRGLVQEQTHLLPRVLGRMVSKRCEMSDVPRTHGVRDGREVRNLERTLAGFISRVRESTRAVSDGRCVRWDRLVFGDYETHDIHGCAKEEDDDE